MSEQETRRARELQESLRTWVLEHQSFGEAAIGSALTYELAASIAKTAKTIEDAHHLLGHLTHTIREQFREFGIGGQHRHP